MCTVWVLWVVIEYFYQHPYFSTALSDRPYFIMLLGFALAGVVGSALAFKKLRAQDLELPVWKISYRGVFLLLLLQIISVIILVSFNAVSYLPKASIAVRCAYFAGFSSLCFLGFFFIISAAFAAGDVLLQKIKQDCGRSYQLIAIALGFSLIGFLLLILGLAKLLIQPVLLVLFVLILGLRYKAVLRFWRSFFWDKRQFEIHNWWTPAVLIICLLLTAFNWIAAFKAFPIGYDGVALYFNTAELTAQYGSLPQGGQSFNWSVIMSLGLILIKSRVISILLAHLMGVLCFLAIFQMGRLWLNSSHALLAACLTLSSPYFAFHNVVDEKIDLGFCFLVLAVFLLLFEAVKNGFASFGQATFSENQEPGKANKIGPLSKLQYVFLLASWIAGFAFGAKYTALIFFMALFCLYMYWAGKKWAYFAALLISLGSLFLFGIYRFGHVPIDGSQALILGALLLVTGIALVIKSSMANFQSLRPAIVGSVILFITVLLSFSPWLVKHALENQSFSVDALLEGKSPEPSIDLVPYLKGKNATGFYSPQNPVFQFSKNQLDSGSNNFEFQTVQNKQKSPANSTADEATRIEVQRYIGYETSFWRYFSLPYDLTNSINIFKSRYLDIGFLFLALFPLFLLARPKRARHPLLLIAALLSFILILAFSYHSVYAPDSFGQFDEELKKRTLQLTEAHGASENGLFSSVFSAVEAPIVLLAKAVSPVYEMGKMAGFPVVVLVLLLLFIVVYLLNRERLSLLPESYKAFCGVMLAYGILWWIMGNGIVWYALPFFVLLPILLLYPFQHPEVFMGNAQKRFTKVLFGSLFGIFLFLNTVLYFTSPFPGDVYSHTILRWPFVEYASNPNAKYDKTLKAFNSILPSTLNHLNKDLSDKVYRVNTHFGFHIEQNDRRVYEDRLLDKYQEISSKFEDNSQFIDVLKANGFKYIFIDLRTASLDKTPEKALLSKFVSLGNLLIQSDKVRLLETDNFVENPEGPIVKLPDGKRARAKRSLKGQVVYFGYLALFEIL